MRRFLPKFRKALNSLSCLASLGSANHFKDLAGRLRGGKTPQRAKHPNPGMHQESRALSGAGQAKSSGLPLFELLLGLRKLGDVVASILQREERLSGWQRDRFVEGCRPGQSLSRPPCRAAVRNVDQIFLEPVTIKHLTACAPQIFAPLIAHQTRGRVASTSIGCYCGAPSTAMMRKLPYFSPTARACVYSGDRRHFLSWSMLSHWTRTMRPLGGSPSIEI